MPRSIGLALALVVAPARAEVPCAAELAIDGPEAAVRELRRALDAELGDRGGETCRVAQVELASRAGGYRVVMSLGDERVEREVGALGDGAIFLASSLVPLLEAEAAVTAAPVQDETFSPKAPAPPPDPAPPAAPPAGGPAATSASVAGPSSPTEHGAQVGVELGAGAVAGLGVDSSAWGGLELGGQLTVNGAAWFGAGFATAADPFFAEDSAAADELRRRLLIASVRGGLRRTVARRVHLDLGVGLGLASALAHHELPDGTSFFDSESAAWLEGRARLVVPLTRHLAGYGALAANGLLALEGEDADELALPAAHPVFLGTAALGFALTWGSLAGVAPAPVLPSEAP